MIDRLSILALLAAGIASVLALTDDYDSAHADGERRICQQLTEGRGEVNGGICQVEHGGEWVTPRLEIRETP